MNTRGTRRLTLNKETLRNLQDSELRRVMGGAPAEQLEYEVDGGGGPCSSSMAEQRRDYDQHWGP